jgi:4-carboxymuconolactone decarboxylase
MSHIAITMQRDGKGVDWMEKVSDADFNGSVAGQPATGAQAAASGPSAAQQLVGDVAPKLAELTDTVLFGDVWARPQLPRRDRSLVTVSALIAMNRPEQLRSHLTIAKQNGVTEEELSEAITHLAFYAGWPSAFTAAGVAKEVFRTK